MICHDMQGSALMSRHWSRSIRSLCRPCPSWQSPFLRSIASCPFFWDSRSLCAQNAHDARHCARASWKAARAMSPRRMCITYARAYARACAHTCAQSPIVDQRSLLKRSLSVREAFAGVRGRSRVPRACRARVESVKPSHPPRSPTLWSSSLAL